MPDHFATQPAPANVQKVPSGPDGPTVTPYSVSGASPPTTVDPGNNHTQYNSRKV